MLIPLVRCDRFSQNANHASRAKPGCIRDLCVHILQCLRGLHSHHRLPSHRTHQDQASPSSVKARTINGTVLPLVSVLAIKFVKLHTLDASRLRFRPDSLCTETLHPGLRLSLPMLLRD